ncbi:MAG: hypothetical protein M8364_16705 [Methylobacter sp.]|uniref:hypothetical protein n=1 Tax=Methylobacter sp. TaxID=2051955 RepID=UPI00258F0EB9|nr:hypothetical protein [Methylobacter sp.]MCL7422533.1 hypothetical protein [Methylobacter sp.]
MIALINQITARIRRATPKLQAGAPVGAQPDDVQWAGVAEDATKLAAAGFTVVGVNIEGATPLFVVVADRPTALQTEEHP